MPTIKLFIGIIILWFSGGQVGHADSSLHTAPRITSLAAVVMDAASGDILFEQNADRSHPPASLTKVVTIHLLLNKIKNGEISFDTPVPLPPESWAMHQPAGSSLMFLGPDQRATVRDILLGLAVPSGNDAGVAAALFIDGSVSAFAERMNREVHRLGLWNLNFVEPSGIDGSNRITAREFAQYLRHYLQEHPESLDYLHSIKEFSFPRPENLLRGATARPITQLNRNSLVFTHPWIDGIKTGFLPVSGFNLAATAKKNGMRLIVVLLGATDTTHRLAIQRRNEEALRLLEYAFANYTTVNVPLPSPTPIRVWKGKTPTFTPNFPDSVPITVRRGREPYIRTKIIQRQFIEAPIRSETNIGKIQIFDEQELIREGNIYAGIEIPVGSRARILLDRVLIFLRKLFLLPTG